VRRHRGFTLIELGVVILVLGLAATVVFPRLNVAGLERMRLRAGADRLADTAAFARNRAACTRQTQVLHLDLDSGTYWVKPQNAWPDQTDAEPRIEGRLPADVKFLDVQIPGTHEASGGSVVKLRFSPEGWADTAAIHVGCTCGEVATVVITALCGGVHALDGRVEMNSNGEIHDASANAASSIE